MPEFLQYLSSLTPARTGNFILNESSFLLSRLLGKPLVAGLPWAAAFEPTTSCNLRCPECPSGMRKFTRQTGHLDLDFYQTVIDQLSPHLLYLTLYFQGEPTLNRSLPEMIWYARQKNIYVTTSTNGNLLDEDISKALVESGLNRLIISMDGLDQETYSKYRIGGDLSKVRKGIENIVHWKKELNSSTPYLELQFLVLGTNEHQIPLLKAEAKALEVDKLSLKSAQLYNHDKNPFLTSLSGFSRYKPGKRGELQLKSNLPNHCHRMWHSPVITWDGNVVPCCFDKDATHMMGDLKHQSFKEIWLSPKYISFRKKLFNHRQEIEICRNCTEGISL